MVFHHPLCSRHGGHRGFGFFICREMPANEIHSCLWEAISIICQHLVKLQDESLYAVFKYWNIKVY